METARIEFEPFINEEARQFIVNGVDKCNIAATSLPDYFPVNFVLRGERGDVLGGVHLWGGWLQATHLGSLKLHAVRDTERGLWRTRRPTFILGALSE